MYALIIAYEPTTTKGRYRYDRRRKDEKKAGIYLRKTRIRLQQTLLPQPSKRKQIVQTIQQRKMSSRNRNEEAFK